MRAIDTNDSTSVTAITVSQRDERAMPHPHGHHERPDPDDEQQRAGPDAAVGFEADLQEALGAGQQLDVAVDDVEVAEQDVAPHAPADHVLGRAT